MKDLIFSIVECLERETDCYARLAVLAESQKGLLVAGDVDSLPQNVRQEEKIVFALGPIIARRNELLAQMAKSLGLKKINLTEAIQKAPLEAVEELKKAVMELIRSAKRLEEINRGNEKLLNNGLAYVDFTLKLIANGGKKKTFAPSLAKEESKPSFVNKIV
jgi:ParB-like chromosome segregation protein Spo0J